MKKSSPKNSKKRANGPPFFSPKTQARRRRAQCKMTRVAKNNPAEKNHRNPSGDKERDFDTRAQDTLEAATTKKAYEISPFFLEAKAKEDGDDDDEGQAMMIMMGNSSPPDTGIAVAEAEEDRATNPQKFELDDRVENE